MTYFEDEPPCMHHRSQFDTIPAPPPDEEEGGGEFGYVLLKSNGYRATKLGREKMAKHGISLPATGVLEFAGGDVPLPKPTRADLVLSAQQWATAVREALHDESVTGGASMDRMSARLDRLDAVLAELAAL
jgi:hypothetical protein